MEMQAYTIEYNDGSERTAEASIEMGMSTIEDVTVEALSVP